MIKILRDKGAKIYIGPHKAKNIPTNISRVIVSNAVHPENVELKTAKRRRIPIDTYSKAVGDIAKRYTTIAVCGAHGKSTTAAMLALALETAGMDPTVIIGTKLHEWGGANFRLGQSKYLVLEADEYKEAFLNYLPAYIIATNIDREHLDHYTTFENVKIAFRKFFKRVRGNGFLVLNKDDGHLSVMGKELLKTGKNVKWYSLQSPEAQAVASVLKIPGKHNLANALGVLALSSILKISQDDVFAVFRQYKGSWRRSEYKGKFFGAKIFDDYAHHPTEIRATLAGFRELYPLSRIWCVFQPHQEHRLTTLFDDFVHAFHYADRVVLLDSYKVTGREAILTKVTKTSPKTSYELAQAIDHEAKKSVYYIPYVSNLQDFLKENIFENDVVIMMGAGNINEISDGLKPFSENPAIPKKEGFTSSANLL